MGIRLSFADGLATLLKRGIEHETVGRIGLQIGFLHAQEFRRGGDAQTGPGPGILGDGKGNGRIVKGLPHKNAEAPCKVSRRRHVADEVGLSPAEHGKAFFVIVRRDHLQPDARPAGQLQREPLEEGAPAGILAFLLPAVGQAEHGLAGQPFLFPAGKRYGDVAAHIEETVEQGGKKAGARDLDLPDGLVDTGHEHGVPLAGNEVEGLYGKGAGHLGLLAGKAAVHIAVHAAVLHGTEHGQAFVKLHDGEIETELPAHTAKDVLIVSPAVEAQPHAVKVLEIHEMDIALLRHVQRCDLKTGLQLGERHLLRALRRVGDAAGNVDIAVVELVRQLFEGDGDPLEPPARVAGDGLQQGRRIAADLAAVLLEDGVLIEPADPHHTLGGVILAQVLRQEVMQRGGRSVLAQVLRPACPAQAQQAQEPHKHATSPEQPQHIPSPHRFGRDAHLALHRIYGLTRDKARKIASAGKNGRPRPHTLPIRPARGMMRTARP